MTTASATRPRSGRQIRIAAHGFQAVIASVGASLRALTADGRDLVVPFDADEVRRAYRGATLAPWPGLAGEPMTCPPDAFTTGVDLVVLEPGAAL